MSPENKKQSKTAAPKSAKNDVCQKPWLPEKWDAEADVVVVGCGGAGTCAAIAAHDGGASVLMLEKAHVGGGNTLTCGGGMTIPTDEKGAYQYYKSLSRGTVDEDTTRAMAQAMTNLPQKLINIGADLEYYTSHPVYPSFPGSESFHQQVHLARSEELKKAGRRWTWGNDLYYFLEKQVKARGIKIMFETPAKKLVQDPVTKEILGVQAESGKKELFVKAKKGVILACGGFQNNKEMLVNFVGHATALPLYALGTPFNTGDGIVMATEVGAKLWHMAGVELGIFGPKAACEKLGMGFRLVRQLPAGSQAIYVNRSAKRFMNEAALLSHRKEPFEVMHFKQETGDYPNVPFFLLFDEAYRKKGMIIETRGWWLNNNLYEWSADNSKEIAQGWIIKADTIKELAGKIGVQAEALEKTISQYNDLCRKGEDTGFGRPKEWLAPIVNPPYYATELCEPVINTQGGPKHNGKAQIVDRNDKPIARLYAAGELGSFFAPLYETCSNVPEALAFGIIAGEQASALKPWE